MLQGALVIFLVGSALCGLAQGMTELIAFRAVQGLGGGGLMVSAQAAIGDVVPPSERGVTMGLFGVPILFAPALGPTIGGYLVEFVDWRTIFLINVPIGLLGIAMAVTLLEEFPLVPGLAFDFADEVALDEHAFTVDTVRDGRFGDAIFIVGGDEGAAFPTWKDPDEVLRHVRLAVGTRSGHPPADLDHYGDRVLSFELASPPVSSTEVRKRIARGEPLDGLVPPAVAREIQEHGLYRGYTDGDRKRT